MSNIFAWNVYGVDMGLEERHFLPVTVVSVSNDSTGTHGTAVLSVSNNVWLHGRTWCEAYGTTRPASATDLTWYSRDIDPLPGYVAYSSGTYDPQSKWSDATVAGPSLRPIQQDAHVSVQLMLLPGHIPMPLTTKNVVATCYFLGNLPQGYGQGG
jgi:hypothetical protein